MYKIITFRGKALVEKEWLQNYPIFTIIIKVERNDSNRDIICELHSHNKYMSTI